MWAYRLERVVLRGPLLWFFRASLHGADHLPASGPFLIASNHASFLDPWLIGALLPSAPVRNLINGKWYLRSWLWKRFFDAHGVVPTAPREPATTILRVVRALGAGEMISVFPEGRISGDGHIGPARYGIGWMAALSGVPVVPCGLRGNYEALSRDRRIPRRHPVELHIGKPLVFPGSPQDAPAPAAVSEFVRRVARTVCVLANRPEDEASSRPSRDPVDLRERLMPFPPGEPQPPDA